MSRMERTQCGTDMSAYFRPWRQSTSWIKLGQGTGWGVFSHRLPSKVLNARQRPNRNSAAPYGFSSLTPWGSSRAPRVRHQGRCIRVRETSKLMSRVAGANATYTTRPSAEATTSNRPRGVTVSRSQRLAPASTGAHRSQTFAFCCSPSCSIQNCATLSSGMPVRMPPGGLPNGSPSHQSTKGDVSGPPHAESSTTTLAMPAARMNTLTSTRSRDAIIFCSEEQSAMSRSRLVLLAVVALALASAAVVTWRQHRRGSPVYSLRQLADAARARDRAAVERYLDVGRTAESVVDEARSEERRVGKECRSRWSPYH